MPVRTRLSLAVALLVTLLLALSAVAVGCLWSLQLHGAALTLALAGAAAIGAVLFAYAIARELPDVSEGLLIESSLPAVHPAPAALPLQEPPIAHLPPEYLAAVRKGMQERHAAFRAQAAQKARAVAH